MNEKLSISENDLNHFLIKKLIDLQTEISINKYAVNTLLSKANPNEMSYIDLLDKIPKEALDMLKFQASTSIIDELKTISTDFDDLIQSFVNPS